VIQSETKKREFTCPAIINIDFLYPMNHTISQELIASASSSPDKSYACSTRFDVAALLGKAIINSKGNFWDRLAPSELTGVNGIRLFGLHAVYVMELILC